MFGFNKHNNHFLYIWIMVMLIVLLYSAVPTGLLAQAQEGTEIQATLPNVSFDRVQAVFDFSTRFVKLVVQVLAIILETTGRVVKLVLDFIPTLPNSDSRSTQLFNFSFPPTLMAPGETLPQQGFGGGIPK